MNSITKMLVNKILSYILACSQIRYSESSALRTYFLLLSPYLGLNIKDEKDIVLFLLFGLIAVILVFSAFTACIETITGRSRFKRAKAAANVFKSDICIVFLSLLVAQIYRAVSLRVFNILLLSIAFAIINALGKLLGMRNLVAYARFVFTSAILSIGWLVFFFNANAQYSDLVNFYRKLKAE